MGNEKWCLFDVQKVLVILYWDLESPFDVILNFRVSKSDIFNPIVTTEMLKENGMYDSPNWRFVKKERFQINFCPLLPLLVEL